MVRATFVLATTTPFRLDLTVWALRRRKNNAVDSWDGVQYRRIVVTDNVPVRLTVVPDSAGVEPALLVTLESATQLSGRVEDEARRLVGKILGLAVDLQPFYDRARGNAAVGSLVECFLGVRPPRFPTIFEGLVNAIACQQVTLDLGISLLNRLSERFGAAFVGDDVVQHAFPTPPDIAGAPEEAIKELGFSHQKTRAIHELAAQVADNHAKFADLDDMTNAEAVEFMSAIRGIGRWSAEYVLLRGLGRLDTFPGDDVGAQNNLQRLFSLPRRPTYDDIRQLTSSWHPYEGMVYFHLLLDKLRANGVV
jgi:DNA-3-methyladenine glycosylase II